MVKDETILEIYKKRIYNELLIEKKKKIAEIVENDEIGKFVEEVTTKYNELLRKNGMLAEVDADVEIFPEYDLTAETEKAVEEIEKEFKDKLDDRDRLITEVKAMLELADDGETKFAIYNNYGIITDDNKIYDYK